MALKIVFNKTRKQTTKTEKPNENENAQKHRQMQWQRQTQKQHLCVRYKTEEALSLHF